MTLRRCFSWIAACFATVFLLFTAERPCHAQFKADAFSQKYNPDSTSVRDTSNKVLDFREICGGLAHKRKMRIGSMFGTSVLVPGAAQIYNEEYWKLPIFYGGIAAGVTSGTVFHFRYKDTGDPNMKLASTLSFVGAGVFYYASLFDGAASYVPADGKKKIPGRAAIYSILLPGLGQAYNGEYWKIPIYVGGLLTAGHFYASNTINYNRYRDIYREVSQPGYHGDSPINATQAKYYRDLYRRYRDYSLVAVLAVYLLQVIDANVFCYMNDFDVSKDLSMKITPSVTLPENTDYAFHQPASIGATFGLRF